MSSPDSDTGSQQPTGHVEATRPVTPVPMMDNDAVISSSQVTLPSTEGPASPIDLSASFQTEVNDDRMSPPSGIIPSSLTPPPSSQMPAVVDGMIGAGGLADFRSQRPSILSPPVTGLNAGSRRDANVGVAEYTPPSPSQVLEASNDELRSMMQACIAEHARLKMETAHYKLQFNLLALQTTEDAKRAEVEYEMVRREIEALRAAEHSRQARRDLSAANDSLQSKYYQLKVWYEEVLEENSTMARRIKAAKKIIQQKDGEIIGLQDDKDMLLNRVRENREHIRDLCSPGGMFHGALSPKTQPVSTPVQHRATPRQTPRSAHCDGQGRADRERNEAPFAALLQVLSQENNSAPSTPTTSHRPGPPRILSKHTRNVQSMSSLPTTPLARPRGEHNGLLPSIDLVPQSEPAHRFNNRHSHFLPETPLSRNPGEGGGRTNDRKSRESTISAEDHAELARQALHVAAAQSFASRAPQHSSQRQPHPADGGEEEEVYESQASQAASEMLRRDPRESFEVVSSAGGSRDGTPAPTGKNARLQPKIFSSSSSVGPGPSPARVDGGSFQTVQAEKRKFSGGATHATTANEDGRHTDGLGTNTSPTKKLRVAGGLSESRVGLGIQYSQEA